MALWNSGFLATPSGSDDPSFGDDRIREFKQAVYERLLKEHNLDLAEAGLQPRQGLHKAGSAVVFYQASAPTQRNGVALAAADAGMVWIDSDDGAIYVLNSSAAWVDVTVSGIHRKIVEIGDWNMDSTANVLIAHGLTSSKIRSISILIRDDAGLLFPINFGFGVDNGARFYVISENVSITRNTGEYFDSTSFDSTSYNRGWVTIDYVD